MKQLIALFVAFVVTVAGAQTVQTTPNLITSGANHTWTGVTTGSIPTGCATAGPCPGGPGPIYDPATNTIQFSYGQATVAQTIAINNALANVGAGVAINGYNYAYDARNMNGDDRQGGVDAFTVSTKLTSNTGATLLSTSQTHNTKFEWTTFSGTQTATTPYSPSGLGQLQFSVSGKDSGFWGGYFGPQIRNVNMSLNYGADLCASNPLSSTTCAGYQQAYTDLQCTANPLYATSCPGYTAAYQTQQCAANPLYSPSCPGYTAAYHDQQCSINPLYMNDCPGYTQAYHDQQCSISALYATDCAGYQQAYHNQQCTANPLYMTDCVGYQAAYKTQQCTLNALYATDCPGYQAAYFNQQCTASGLYSKQCPNYSTAYATQMVLQPSKPTVETTPVATVASVPVAVQSPVEQATTLSSTTSATSVTSVNSVVAAPSVSSPTGVTSMTSVSSSQSSSSSSSTTTSSAPAPKQSVKEPDQKQAAARAQAATKAMENATKMEDQVAAQGAVVNAMAFVPGFSAYQNALVPDINQLRMARQYNKPPVDNDRTRRLLGGAQEHRWNEMVDSQYQLGK